VRQSPPATAVGSTMAYAVDAQIREMNKRLTADKVGDEGEDWLHSDAAQRMSLANPEMAHTRTVISKFGGTIKQGAPLAIPTQTWNEDAARNPFSLSPDSFRNRSQPTHVIVNGGIPGYRGHRPHAANWTMPHRRADRHSPFLKPFLAQTNQSLEEYPANAPHDTDGGARFAMPDKAKMPRRMPIPGYTGHLPGTTNDSVGSFGTSHWRKELPATRAQAQAEAFAMAQQRGRDSFLGYDDYVDADDQPYAC